MIATMNFNPGLLSRGVITRFAMRREIQSLDFGFACDAQSCSHGDKFDDDGCGYCRPYRYAENAQRLDRQLLSDRVRQRRAANTNIGSQGQSDAAQCAANSVNAKDIERVVNLEF